MQFKNPELLFALLFLIIPILVHLFQLRKFQKTPFTNVKFLKEVTLQTRKSSKIKKWLVLFTRLAALACIIFAFAQPFTTSKESSNTETETVIYIDNSFSLQAKGGQGELLRTVTQDLYKSADIPTNLSWFSNSSTARNVSSEDFKNSILDLDYSSNQISFDEVLLKAQNLFSNNQNTEKNLIWISDFQGQQPLPDATEEITISTHQLTPSNTNNIAVDSLYISAVNSDLLELTAVLNNHGEAIENLPVSLNENETLIAKAATPIEAFSSATVPFEVKDGILNGSVLITDQSLLFDNMLYFSINEKTKIKVLSIQQDDDAFLRKIYTADEFDFISQAVNQLDFNIIQQQNTIILNGVQEISGVLQTALKSFADNNGTLIIIPANDIDAESYRSFFNQLNLGNLSQLNDREKQITTIHFDHPVFQNVFENEVTNFQYPQVNSYYTLSRKHTPILSFEDRTGFLMQNQNVYFFSSSLAMENSSFTNSPLVVPSFYRIAKQSLPLPDLYYTIGNQNDFAVNITLPRDHILSLRNENTDFIPQQQNSSNKVIITTTDQPETAGTYGIYDKDNLVEYVSFNYNRNESSLQFQNAATWQDTSNFNSINAMFEKVARESNVQNYWKWFVIFALFFLAIELFLLKYLK
tara:strand:+ start:92589 stop:94508 length:1920 start_codon:yes stop_codon:yes gene_type:complete